MYLKSLELHGFKSFPNRTILTFERGATVIVGPNGSGKSNISDAMRWVLGELSSRNIRGTKMEDVIFGGTDDRRPMGFAEVTVVFDNSDPDNRLDSPYDEVSVTRRYYRTGESEYLINKEPKRLRDIYQLFMDTGVGREGYSIIGQGKIAEIISKKSDERRSIFEEAAGISKYRHRKEEAERKLKGTQENLDRVKDILLELESQVGPLEKEAEKARRGLAIYEEKKRADVSLWLYDTSKIRIDIDEAEKALLLAQKELDIIEQAISDLEMQSENLYLKAQENKLQTGNLLEEIRLTSERIHTLDNALSVAESNVAHFEEMVNQCLERISEINASIATLVLNKSEYESRVLELESSIDSLTDERLSCLAEQQNLTVEVDRATRQLTEMLDEIMAEEGTASSIKVRIDVLQNSKISDGMRSEDIEKEIEAYESEATVLREDAEKAEESTREFKAQIEQKEEIVVHSTQRIEELTEEKEQLFTLLRTYRTERDSLLGKADTLEKMTEHFDGFLESVRTVMNEYQKGNIPRVSVIHGPLSTLIHVRKEYITAIDTALGQSLQNIVVDNEETAKAAIHFLKTNNKGRATFYPITAIRSQGDTPEIRECAKYAGYVGRADTLVDCESEYRAVLEHLLVRTVVFDNIENASKCAKALRYRVKLVTLDGQIIGAGGSFTGGSSKRESGILSRQNEINSLRQKAEEKAKKIQECESSIAEIDEEIAEEKNKILDASQEKEILLTLSRSQFNALESANAKYIVNQNTLEKLRYDYQALLGQATRAEEEIRELTIEYNAALERIEALKSKRSLRAEEMGVMDEKRDEYGQKANEVQIKITVLRGEIDTAKQMISSLDERIDGLNGEIAEQQKKIDELKFRRDNIDTLREENHRERLTLEEKLHQLNEQHRELEAGSDDFEQAQNEIRQKLKEKNASRDVAREAMLRQENALNNLKEKQDSLGGELWDEYEISYEDAIALQYPPVTAENRDEVAALQTSCRNRLRNIGHFDPDSIQKYADVKSRFDSLTAQYNDLTKSYDELIDIIDRLQDEMKESFVVAFESINKNFAITFRELFGGGNAELLLVNPEDVLTSGIEIKAAPPGKIIKSMSLLSGGEQSFVAIALLFAILKVNPTPFCILDEIEAALDEVNVFRFGEYIKRMSDGTQFILITHRRGTMEVGNRLYGVTMPQRGISQAIELNVNEIEGKQEELLDGIL